MTFPTQLSRLCFLPLAGLYVMISVQTGDKGAWAALIAMITLSVVMIFKGVAEEPSPVEAGFMAITWGALLLAALFPAASFATPGICTDSVLTFEIALAFFSTAAIMTWSHLWSKKIYPANRKGLTRSEQRWVSKLPVWLMCIISLASLGIMASVVDTGACAPGTDKMMVLPIISLIISGFCGFTLSAAWRWKVKP